MIGWYISSKDYEAIRARHKASLNEAVIQSLKTKGIFLEHSSVKKVKNCAVDGIEINHKKENEDKNKIIPPGESCTPLSPSPSLNIEKVLVHGLIMRD